MQRTVLLLAALLAWLALPTRAHAELLTYPLWRPSWEHQRPVPRRSEAVQPDEGNRHDAGFTVLCTSPKVAPERDRRGSAGALEPEAPPGRNPGHHRTAAAARSRAGAQLRAYLGFSDARARACQGVPGYHNSPPPPSS